MKLLVMVEPAEYLLLPNTYMAKHINKILVYSVIPAGINYIHIFTDRADGGYGQTYRLSPPANTKHDRWYKKLYRRFLQ